MIKVLSTDNANKAAIVKQMLEENNIKVVLLNKQDSSYLMFGLIELYIQEDQLEKTEDLLKEINNVRNT
jgi:aspartokinase